MIAVCPAPRLGPGDASGAEAQSDQTVGVSTHVGTDALLGPTMLAGLAANDNGNGLHDRRLEARFGYGFGAFGDRFTATPEIAVGLSDTARDYSLGWRLARDDRVPDGGSLELALEARRREPPPSRAFRRAGIGFADVAL